MSSYTYLFKYIIIGDSSKLKISFKKR